MFCKIKESQVDDIVNDILEDSSNIIPIIKNKVHTIMSSTYKSEEEGPSESFQNINVFIKSIAFKLLEVENKNPDIKKLTDTYRFTGIASYLKFNVNKFTTDILKSFDLKNYITDITESRIIADNITEEISSKNIPYAVIRGMELEITNLSDQKNQKRFIADNDNKNNTVVVDARVLENNMYSLLSVGDATNIDLDNIDISYYAEIKKGQKNITSNKDSIDFGTFIDSVVKEYFSFLKDSESSISDFLLYNKKLQNQFKFDNYALYIDRIMPDLLKLKIFLTNNFYIINGDKIALFDKGLRMSGIADIVLINKNTNELSVLEIKSSLSEFNINQDRIDKYKTQLSLYAKILENKLGKSYPVSKKNYIFLVKGQKKSGIHMSSELIGVSQADLNETLLKVRNFYKKIDSQIIGQYVKPSYVAPLFFSDITRLTLDIHLQNIKETKNSSCS